MNLKQIEIYYDEILTIHFEMLVDFYIFSPSQDFKEGV